MTFIVSLKENRPGFADFEIKRWSGSTDSPLEFTIKRNQDERYLAGHEEWKVEPVWHALGYSEFNGNLVGTFEPWVTDSLVHTGGQTMFMMSLRESSGSFRDDGVVRMASNILASSAAGNLNRTQLNNPTPQSPAAQAHTPYVEPVPEPEPVIETFTDPEPVPEPIEIPATDMEAGALPPVVEPVIDPQNASNIGGANFPTIEDDASKRRTSPIVWIILMILLIAAIGAAVWWFVFREDPKSAPTPKPNTVPTQNNNPPPAPAPKPTPKPEPKPEPKPTPAPAAPPAPAESACTVKSGSDVMAFIQSCLKTNPDTDQILKIINEAKAAKECDLARRLYANKAQSGNSVIAFAYAKEYDPKTAASDGCFKEDKGTAIYWYETGLSDDPNNAEAKARLQELQK